MHGVKKRFGLNWDLHFGFEHRAIGNRTCPAQKIDTFAMYNFGMCKDDVGGNDGNVVGLTFILPFIFYLEGS